MFGGRDCTSDDYSSELIGIDFVEQGGAGVGRDNSRAAHYVRLRFVPDSVDEDPKCLMLGNKAAQASYHTCTMVAHAATIYLYGGFGSVQGVEGGVPYWDQHFYELLLASQTWRRITAMPVDDPRRRGHTAVVHRGRMHVFGGWGPAADWWRNDIDSFGLSTRKWSKCSPRGAVDGPAVANHTAVVHGDNMVVFGGHAELSASVGAFEVERGDPLLLSGTATAWGTPSPQAAPGGVPTVTAIDSNTSCMLHGTHTRPSTLAQGRLGEAGGTLFASNAVWVFSFETRRWMRRKCAGSIPPARAHHSATLHKDLMFVVGGEAEGDVALSDVRCLDVSGWLWTEIDCSPSPLPPVSGHACVVSQRSLVVLGGSHFGSYRRCGQQNLTDQEILADLTRSSPRKTRRGSSASPKGPPPLKQRLSTATANMMLWCHSMPLTQLEAVHQQRRKEVRQELVDGGLGRVVRKPEEVESTVSRLMARYPPREEKPAKAAAEEEEEPDEEEEEAKREKARKWLQLRKRLYDKLPQKRENRQKDFEKRFLQPIVPESQPQPLSKLVKKFHDKAVEMRRTKHDQLLTNTLTKWQGGKDGRWEKANWKEDERLSIKRMLMRARGEVPHVPEGRNDDVNRRFYEDRKPTGETAQKKQRYLFNKWDTLAQGRKWGESKAGPERVQELNKRFYYSSCEGGRQRRDKLRAKYLHDTQPQFTKRSNLEWSETITRLGSPRA